MTLEWNGQCYRENRISPLNSRVQGLTTHVDNQSNCYAIKVISSVVLRLRAWFTPRVPVERGHVQGYRIKVEGIEGSRVDQRSQGRHPSSGWYSEASSRLSISFPKFDKSSSSAESRRFFQTLRSWPRFELEAVTESPIAWVETKRHSLSATRNCTGESITVPCM